MGEGLNYLIRLLIFLTIKRGYASFVNVNTAGRMSEFRIRYLGNTSNYNKFERPITRSNGSTSTEPVKVQVLLHIESIREISSESTLDFYLVQFWRDERLTGKNVKVTGWYLPDDLWYADTYFLLVRDLQYSNEEQYVIIDKEGNVEYNRKVRLRTPCTPNVLLFPFDIANCSLRILSYGYTDKELVYEWFKDTQRHDNGYSQPGVFVDKVNNRVDYVGFNFLGVKTKHSTLMYGKLNYSSLEVSLQLKRKFSAYLFQVYIPAALIVVLSWTVFWINVRATPARASLGVTTVLTMLTLSTQSQTQNAKHVSNNMTALDIYLWVSFFFVIFAMLEFALSDYRLNFTRSRITPGRIVSHNRACQIHGSNFYPNSGEKDAMNTISESCFTEHYQLLGFPNNDDAVKGITSKTWRYFEDDSGSLINQCARVVFPALYTLFNFIYWLFIWYVSQRKEDEQI